MSTIDEILAAVRSLPSEERGRLIPLIWDEISPANWAAPSSEWISESHRRSVLLDEGLMETEDWEAVRKRARQLAGLSE